MPLTFRICTIGGHMKAAKAFREQWEEANLLRLIYFANNVYAKINLFAKRALILINVLIFIFYKAGHGLWLIVKVLLLSEPEFNRIERDETWIFRQLK
jgi:hypothetical protein